MKSVLRWKFKTINAYIKKRKITNQQPKLTTKKIGEKMNKITPKLAEGGK